MSAMKKTLVILAAGIGSRYGGGVKQLEPVGPDGEIIIDYSIHDAIRAGFNKIIFIIRRDIEADFREVIGDRIEALCEPLGVEVCYAFQSLTDAPIPVPEGRTKPWGTGQAVLACEGLIHEPFAVINADDYYGKNGFAKAAAFLDKGEYGLIGYVLKNTLSDNGGVTRGLCDTIGGRLIGIDETKNIVKTPRGIRAGDKTLAPGMLVSMNFWCLPASFLDVLREGFPKFLASMTDPLKDEYLLPIIVDGLLKVGTKVSVIPTDDAWFGVTYKEDKPAVVESFRRLYAEGAYAEPLYSDLRSPDKTPVLLRGKTVLVTGSPGFIGAHLVLRLLEEMPSGTIVSLDNMNDYYDPALKEYRLARIEAAASSSRARHVFIRGSIADKALIDSVFDRYRPELVVNLAAQDGVRFSMEHPDVCMESNLIGFYNILEGCRRCRVEHLVFGSSSSVYEAGTGMGREDHPVSVDVATKKSNELLAQSYASLYNIPITGLRLFSVYGPAGRPDMFYYAAAEKLVSGGTVRIYNQGESKRDFTFVDDAVESILRVLRGAPERKLGVGGLPAFPYAVYDVGRGKPESVLDFISTLQEELVRAGVLPRDYDFAAHRELVGMQPGDVAVTYADAAALETDYAYRPATDIRRGLRAFAEWYANYRK